MGEHNEITAKIKEYAKSGPSLSIIQTWFSRIPTMKKMEDRIKNACKLMS